MQDGAAQARRVTGKVVKIGSELVAVLTPNAARLGVREGDTLELEIPEATQPPMTREEAVTLLDSFKGMKPTGYTFNRDEANERVPHGQD